MLRLGLCCTFLDAPIKFRTTTARRVSGLDAPRRVELLRELGLHNATALARACTWCAEHGVGAFRVNSGILPLYTHPEVGCRSRGRRAWGSRRRCGRPERARGPAGCG